MHNWKKWIWPGVFAVVILTVLSTLFRADVVESDLTTKTLEGLKEKHSWASVELDGRDLTLTGSSPSKSATDDALRIIDEAYDVRITNNLSGLIPEASPYIFKAEKSDRKLVLSGNVPNNDVKADIVKAAQEAAPDSKIEDQLTLARGQVSGFSKIAKFSIGEIAELSTGTASMSDADLSITGLAPTYDAYDDVVRKLADTIPGDGNLVKAEITPPTASPYEFMADYDGEVVELTGFAPDRDSINEISKSFKEKLPEARVRNRMRIAAGAPNDFANAAKSTADFMPALIKGRASITDTALSVSGVPKSSSDYETAIQKVGNLTAGYTLVENNIQPIGISPYNWSAAQDGETVTLTGFAPSTQVRDNIAEDAKKNFPSATIDNQLQIAGGETAQFSDANAYGLSELKRFTKGEAKLVDDVLTFSGRAKSIEDYDALVAGENAPEGLKVNTNVIPPVVKPYRFSATKADDLVLSGFVPNENTRTNIISIARKANPGISIIDEMKLAEGIPDGITWASSTAYGLRQLGKLDEGQMSIIDGNYAISGKASSIEVRDKAIADIESGLPGGLKLASQAITAPEPVAEPTPPAPPIANPYRWSVSNTKSGVRVSGNVASKEDNDGIIAIVKSSLGVTDVTDKLTIASGKPDSFDVVRRIAINQVKKLEAGQGNLIDKSVSINGRASSEAIANEIQSAIANSLPVGYSGSTNILFPTPEPAPEPVAAPKPPEPAVADPYRWSLSKTKSGVRLSGNVASQDDADSIISIVKSSLGVSEITDKQSIASGKPEGFDDIRRIVTNQVKRLEAGQGNMIGSTVSINGRASSEEIANEITDTIENKLPAGYLGSTNILFPEPEPVVPTANPYRWSISKQTSGITLRGNVADEASQKSVVAMVEKSLGSVSADKQTIAQGKPEGFDDARKLVTSQLRLLDAGQGNVIGNTLSVSGKAKNENIKNLIDKIIQKRTPEGFIGSTNILFPKPEPAQIPTPIVVSISADACQALIVKAINGQKILFETDKAVIKTESEGILKAVAEAASECPRVRMEIAGHTDSRGRDAYNQELSEARANSIKTYLANAGLDAKRLDAKGYGETQPIASNSNSDGRAQNRRIEFNVIK